MTLLQWAQFVALVLAALFFLARAWQGWFYVNMSLSGKTERRIREDGWDDLVVEMTFTKGKTGNISIHDAAVCVSWSGASPRYRKLNGIAHVETEPIKKNGKIAAQGV